MKRWSPHIHSFVALSRRQSLSKRCRYLYSAHATFERAMLALEHYYASCEILPVEFAGIHKIGYSWGIYLWEVE